MKDLVNNLLSAIVLWGLAGLLLVGFCIRLTEILKALLGGML